MEPERLKSILEEKYLAACAEICALGKAQGEGRNSDRKIADTVMSMLAAERKKTILAIYGLAFPGEALSRLIGMGLAVEAAKAQDAEGEGKGSAA